MRGFKSMGLTLTALGLAMVGIGAPGQAAIYNIAATDSAGLDVSLQAGFSYLIKWVGIADGGLYDAANVSFCTPSCSSGFSNAFYAGDEDYGSNDYDLDIFTTGSLYASAADSLAAYKAGDNIHHNVAHLVNGKLVSVSPDGFVPNPWIYTPDVSGTAHLFVLDADGDRSNNSGGVSLSIERLAEAVPEPASWTMLLAGFGLVGAAMRRRPNVGASFA